MTKEDLIFWLEINTPNDEVRQKIIDLLMGQLIEEEKMKRQKGELYHVTMSRDRYKLFYNMFLK